MLDKNILRFEQATPGDTPSQEYMFLVLRYADQNPNFVVCYEPGHFICLYKGGHYDIFRLPTKEWQPVKYHCYSTSDEGKTIRLTIVGMRKVHEWIETKYKSNPQFSLAFHQNV